MADEVDVKHNLASIWMMTRRRQSLDVSFWGTTRSSTYFGIRYIGGGNGDVVKWANQKQAAPAVPCILEFVPVAWESGTNFRKN